MNNPNLTGTRPTKMRFNRNLLSCALVACLAMSAPAMAQSTAATLRGQVAAGSTITVTNVETGLSRSAQATANGNYTIPGLPPGTYRVDGGAGGSRTITRRSRYASCASRRSSGRRCRTCTRGSSRAWWRP